MTLIELMVSMAVLAIGLGALSTLIVTTLATNSRNSKDTSATLLAQMVVEQISSQHPNSTATVAVSDCAGNTWTIATAGGAPPNGTGAALVTDSSNLNYGGIDQSQDTSSIPSGYSMHYVTCSNADGQTTYDVRWNVMTVDGNYTRLVTASARPLRSSSSALGGRLFTIPVTLRTIAGP